MSFWPRELPKTHKPEEMGIDQDHAISYSFPFPYISISHDFPRLPQKFPIDIDGPIATHGGGTGLPPHPPGGSAQLVVISMGKLWEHDKHI